MTKEKITFPKYEELGEEERQRLRDTVGQGILEAQAAAPGLVGMIGETNRPDRAEGFWFPVDGDGGEVERTPHVLETAETEPGEYVHRIAFGRMRFARKH